MLPLWEWAEMEAARFMYRPSRKLRDYVVLRACKVPDWWFRPRV